MFHFLFAKKLYQRTIVLFSVALFLLAGSFFTVLFWSPSFSSLFDSLQTESSQVDRNRWEAFGWYVQNNGFRVPFQIFLLACLPIPYLYFINVGLTSVFIGIALYLPIPLANDQFTVGHALAGTALHGVFEMIGFCFIAALLHPVHRSIRGKLANLVRPSKHVLSLLIALKHLGIGYLTVALPLLIAAGLIEAFISPLLV